MPVSNTPLKSILGLTLLASGIAVMSGCPKDDADAMSAEDQIRAELAQEIAHQAEYTVRGQVVSLPTANDDLMVHHEAIPEYRSAAGMGMDVMTMPFPLGEGISLDGIEPGDIVNLTFSVDYNENWSPTAYRLTMIEELPADTELDFTPLPKDN